MSAKSLDLAVSLVIRLALILFRVAMEIHRKVWLIQRHLQIVAHLISTDYLFMKWKMFIN